MSALIAILCLIAALALLAALSGIDLKHGILPDKLVLCLALAGLTFHFSTDFIFSPPPNLLLGALLGGGLLYSVRALANCAYKTDTLGLGDVKLLAATGLWLGPAGVLTAIIAGALAGIIHGLGLAALSWSKTGRWPDMSAFSLPAGPGFAVGIVIAAIFEFRHFHVLVLS